ncbi:MAG: TolC family protein [Nitrospirota bacterium]|nr:TolC family protein [Nitrospirota bacterium]
MRRLACTTALILISTAAAMAEEPATAPTTTMSHASHLSHESGGHGDLLDKYILEALDKNPELKAIEQQVEALRQRPAYEHALDDPMLRFSVENLPWSGPSFTDEAMTMKSIGLSQRFPSAEKRELKRDMAIRDVEVAERMLDDRKNAIVRDVKRAYLDLAFINQNIDIITHHQDLIRQIIRIAETRYSVGVAPQQDALKAQVGLSEFIDDEIMLRQKRETALARLNFLAFRTTEEARDGDEPREITKTPFSLSLEELRPMAIESRPSLKAASKMVERAETALKLAKKDYYPDFEVGVSYGQRETMDDLVSAMVTVNLPVWKKDKLDPKAAEAAARIGVARHEYAAMKNEVFFMLRDLMAEVRRAERQMQLFETGILPQARQSLKSAMAGYQVGKVDFFFLQDTQLNLFDFELKYTKALTDYEQKLAELEFVVGKRLF